MDDLRLSIIQREDRIIRSLDAKLSPRYDGETAKVRAMNTRIIEITRRNERMFEFAKRMAELSSYGKFRHGAILAHHGVVLNASHNKDKPCSFGSRFRCRSKGQATLHAELGAILNMPRESTEGSDVYVVRINYDNQFRNSKPCPMCQEAMRFCGIKRVFYSTQEGHFEMMKL